MSARASLITLVVVAALVATTATPPFCDEDDMPARRSTFNFARNIAIASTQRPLLNALTLHLDRLGIPYEVLTYRLRLAPQSTTAVALAQQTFPINKGHTLVTGLGVAEEDGNADYLLDALSVANRQITDGQIASSVMIAEKGNIAQTPSWPWPIRINAGDTLNVSYHDTIASGAEEGRLVIEVVHVPTSFVPQLADIPTLEWFVLGSDTIATATSLQTNRDRTFDEDTLLDSAVRVGDAATTGVLVTLRLNEEMLIGEPITFGTGDVWPSTSGLCGSRLNLPVRQGDRLHLEVANNAGANLGWLMQFQAIRPWR